MKAAPGQQIHSSIIAQTRRVLSLLAQMESIAAVNARQLLKLSRLTFAAQFDFCSAAWVRLEASLCRAETQTAEARGSGCSTRLTLFAWIDDMYTQNWAESVLRKGDVMSWSCDQSSGPVLTYPGSTFIIRRRYEGTERSYFEHCSHEQLLSPGSPAMPLSDRRSETIMQSQRASTAAAVRSGGPAVQRDILYVFWLQKGGICQTSESLVNMSRQCLTLFMPRTHFHKRSPSTTELRVSFLLSLQCTWKRTSRLPDLRPALLALQEYIGHGCSSRRAEEQDLHRKGHSSPESGQALSAHRRFLQGRALADAADLP